MEYITYCEAVAKRIKQLLKEKNMSMYRLEQNSGIEHGTMHYIIHAKNKNIKLSTLYQLARGFDMKFIEFIDNPLFDDDNFNID